jgi:hypothetical protein
MEVSCNTLVNGAVVDNKVFDLFDDELTCTSYWLGEIAFEIGRVFDDGRFLLCKQFQLVKDTMVLDFNGFVVRLTDLISLIFLIHVIYNSYVIKRVLIWLDGC